METKGGLCTPPNQRLRALYFLKPDYKSDTFLLTNCEHNFYTIRLALMSLARLLAESTPSAILFHFMSCSSRTNTFCPRLQQVNTLSPFFAKVPIENIPGTPIAPLVLKTRVSFMKVGSSVAPRRFFVCISVSPL